ncbi:hypothetical protein [Arthrobacter sp. GMC3]|uniref:hypothetical protein n=1 Tax=Arthrobacter sp. GMC3 TaxID=2058894 RepID=UPI000CE42FC6|nr:hypothetical protein [Arthrobacter sp. GMC3]
MSDDLERLASDLASSPERVMKEIRQVVSKGSLKIKNQMRSEARGSLSFKRMAETINYDINADGNSVEGEVGPDKDVMTPWGSRRGNRSGSDGSAASLAGIAYFGGARGGGGTLPDPLLALQAEEGAFVDALSKLDGVILE